MLFTIAITEQRFVWQIIPQSTDIEAGLWLQVLLVEFL